MGAAFHDVRPVPQQIMLPFAGNTQRFEADAEIEPLNEPTENDEFAVTGVGVPVWLWLPVRAELVALDEPTPAALGKAVLAADLDAVADSGGLQNSTTTRPAPPLTDSSRAPTPTPGA